MDAKSRELLVKSISTSYIDKDKRIADLISSEARIIPLHQKTIVFSEAEQLLLDEARNRFEFEQKSAASLHTKSTLFLSIAGVFAALITAYIGRLLDRTPSAFFETAALAIFLLSLGFLTVAAILLGRTALSRSYRVIATPSRWWSHFTDLRKFSESGPDPESEAFVFLQQDILAAWIQAAEKCCAANEAKAWALDRVLKLLYIAVLIAFFGVLLLIVQRTIH
jgi:hypothetical protein